MPEVIVLHAPVASNGERAAMSPLLERLPYGRRLDLERRDAAARAASLQGLELLLAGVEQLRGMAPDVSCLSFPQGGKPALAGGPWFSLSHSHSRVAVAVSDACDLGLDVEDLAPGADAAHIARWTAVEATLKAAGSGVSGAPAVQLGIDLGSARFAGREYQLQRVVLVPGCVSHLASERSVRVEVREL